MPDRPASVAVIGEALVDVVLTPGQASRRYPGGSPANVAVGLARLGVDVDLVTQLGADADGDLIEQYLATNGVRLPQPRDPHPTSVAEVTIGADGSASYEFQITWSLAQASARAAAAINQAACVHIGSVGATLAPGAETVRALVESARAEHTISYDPNCRPQLMGEVAVARTQIESLVGLSDVVKVSADDLAWLYPGERDDEAASAWLLLGPKLIIVTRGAHGSWAITTDGTVAIGAVTTQVIDTVGAGDSFMAAVLAALAERDLLGGERRAALARIDAATVVSVLEFAARAAAITCGRAGADPPTRAELCWPDQVA